MLAFCEKLPSTTKSWGRSSVRQLPSLVSVVDDQTQATTQQTHDIDMKSDTTMAPR